MVEVWIDNPESTVIQKDTIGQVINFTIKQDDTPKDLTSCTVLIALYKQGTNDLLWSKSATVISAADGTARYTTVSGDFNTAGSYYTFVTGTYTSGSVFKVSGPIIEVIQNNESILTPQELLTFMDIATENAKSTATIQDYIETAESLLDLEVNGEIDTTNSALIKIKQMLIKLKSAIIYFQNSDENASNPNLRLQKIEAWEKSYNNYMSRYNEVLSSTSTGSGVVRRIRSTDYENENTRDYDYIHRND